MKHTIALAEISTCLKVGMLRQFGQGQHGRHTGFRTLEYTAPVSLVVHGKQGCQTLPYRRPGGLFMLCRQTGRRQNSKGENPR